jgi:type I site-specific restriction-modification system R (restriction) subunit
MTNNNLTEYYAKRAWEYDNIYSKPERQNDIKSLSELLTNLLKRKSVLEVLKNFPSKAQFESIVKDFTDQVHFNEFEFFWCGYYQLGGLKK